MIILLILGIGGCRGCYTDGSDAVEGNAAQQARCTCPPVATLSTERNDVPPEGGPGNGRVAIQIASEPGTLLSLFSAHPAIAQIVDHNVLEPLFLADSRTAPPVGVLAVEWAFDPETVTYRIYLKPDVLWHDGTPFTAEDVVFTLELLLDSAMGAVFRNQFDHVVAIRKMDTSTVEIELAMPDYLFLNRLSQVMILPAHVFVRSSIAEKKTSWLPVGTGPYRMKRWKQGTSIELIRYSDWHNGQANIQSVVYRIVSELRVAIDLFKGQQLDLLLDIENRDALSDGYVVSRPLSQFIAWTYNTHNPLFDDKRVRQALSMLIDTNAIRCSIMGCIAGGFDELWDGAQPETPPAVFNPHRARKRLKQAGWKDVSGNGVLEKDGRAFSFTLLLPDTDPQYKRIATVVQHDLARSGIRMNVVVVNWAVYTDRLRHHRFDASIVAVSTWPFLDVESLFHRRGIQSGRNFGLFENDEIDDIIDGLATEDEKVRRRRQHRLVQAIIDEQPITFLARPYRRMLVRNTLGGVDMQGRGVRVANMWMHPPNERHQPTGAP